MRKRRVRKRILSVILTVALVLTIIPMDAFTLKASAAITGNGTVDNPYLISSLEDWNAFAENVTNGTKLYENEYVKLTADIGSDQSPITETVGKVSGSTQQNAFKGTFDGGGHTITVSISNTSDQGTAPFRYVSGATIKNMKVTGTVNGTMHCAGLVGFAASGTTCTIKNCEVAVSVNCGGSSHSHCGGILGHGLSSSTTISNCLFSGSISDATDAVGIIYGWGDNGSHKIESCLSAGNYGNCGGVELLKKCDGSAIIANCYRKTSGGTLGEDASGYGAADLAAALNNGGEEWQVVGDNVVPIMAKDPHQLQYAAIGGVNSSYFYSDAGISITPVVVAADGTVLTLGTNFTATLDGTNVTAFPFSVTDEGDHVLTITGTGSEASGYYGSKAFGFSIEDYPEGLSIDDAYTKGQDGYYYVNLPKTGTKVVTLPGRFTSSFKVYDDGGKGGTGKTVFDESGGNYSCKCSGTLVLTAPEGYLLQLSGNIKTEFNCDKLTVYDGEGNSGTKLIDAVYSVNNGKETAIQTVTSSGQSMAIYFYSDGAYNYDGLDLTVTLISTNVGHNVNVATTTDGTLVSDKSTAKINDTVTLTATPDEGCVLCNIRIVDEDNELVDVDWDTWTNTATFIMPATDVTVTPTFSSERSVNMPKTGTKTVIIPSGIQSFKVYDDGGMGGTGESKYNTSGGNYSNDCDGTLILTAPEGYVLQLSGRIRIQYFYDRLNVYDNSEASGTMLIGGASSDESNIPKNITTVVSTDQSMTLFFHSNDYGNYDGLDLTVTLVSAGTEYNVTVNNPSAGGTVVSNKGKSLSHKTVTLTATPDEGYVLSELTVVDADNIPVDVVWDTWTNTASFTMPATDVTINPTFTNDLTSLYVNMPGGGNKNAIIPMDVRSFKVYDDGGKYGKYSKLYDGTLVLIAPEGFLLQLSGSIKTDTFDKLTVYDSQGTGGTKLLDAVTSTGNGVQTDVQTVVSTDRYMTLYFNSHNGTTYAGFDFTVTLINVSGKSGINVKKTTGGTASSDKSMAKANETVTLTATPDEGYVLFGLSVVDADNNPLSVDWSDWSDTATFTMPATAVTVTPTFSNELFVNMPKTGDKTVTIPLGVWSFKVYDDGGADGNYSNYCNGTLILTAPDGYVLKLSGSIKTEFNDDNFTVFDGEGNSGNKLIDAVSCFNDGIQTPIQTVISSGQSMTLYFCSDDYDNYAGLDLTVTIHGKGDCGAEGHEGDVKWSFQDGTLTIYKAENAATGAMADYTFGDGSLPWRSVQSDITSVIIGEGVTHVGDYAFSGCTNFASVTIPASVETIGEGAFFNSGNISDSHLSSVTFAPGSKCETIGNYAFERLPIISIELPATVTSIGEAAFAYSDTLESVSYAGEDLSVGKFAFDACGNLSNFPFEGVTSIGENAFEFTALTSVAFSDALTSIGNKAFQRCEELTSVVIDGSGMTTVGESAFYDCDSLKIVEISGVKSIENGAFESCSVLETLTITGCDTGTIIKYAAYRDCHMLANLTLKGVSTIGNNAFRNCYALESVEIPDGVTSIGEYAFDNCKNLAFVILPPSVTSVDYGALFKYNKQAMTVYAPSTLTLGEDQLEMESTTIHYYSKVTFGDLVTATGTVMMPDVLSKDNYFAAGDTITIVPEEGYAITKMTATSSGNSLTVENNAFTMPKGDVTVTALVTFMATEGNCGSEGHEGDVKWSFQDGTLTIYKAENASTGAMADYTFGDGSLPWRSVQSGITSVIIGEGVTHVGNYAFSGCTNFASVTIPASVETIGEGAFFTSGNISDNHLSSVTFAPGSKCETIGNYAFECLPIISIELPATVTSIGEAAFGYSDTLESVSYAGTDLSIGKSAFADCKNLSSFQFDSVTSIDEYAFQITALTSVVLSDKLTSVGGHAFQNCQSLSAVVISGNGMTTVGEYAFYDCDSLKTVEISGVKSIETGAFESCNVLETLTITGCDTGTIIKFEAYRYCTMLANLTLKGVSTIGDKAFYNCYALESVEIPDGVTSIGEHAFDNCTNLAFVILPPSVTSVGYGALFKYNKQPMTVYAPSTLTLGEDQVDMESTTIHYYSKVTLEDYVNATGTAMTPDVLSKESYFVEGDTVTIAPEEGYVLTGVTATSAGNSLTVVNNAFTMPGSDVTVTAVCDEILAVAKAVSVATRFSGRFEMNFYLYLPKSVIEDEGAYVYFTGGAAERKILVSEAGKKKINGKTAYRFTYPVNAREVRNIVSLKLYDGQDQAITVKSATSNTDYTATGVNCSLYDYLITTSTSTDKKMAALSAAALDYCTSAQLYFDYNPGGDELNVSAAVDAVTDEEMEQFAPKLEGTLPAGVSIDSISALFESDNSFRLYLKFNKKVDPADYSVFVNGEEAQLQHRSGRKYYVEITNVPSNHLDDEFKITVSKGGKSYYVTASVLTYARSCNLYGSDSLKRLARAMYLYNAAAVEKFGK